MLKSPGYLPNLISKIEIIGSDVFKGIFETWEIVPMAMLNIGPRWELRRYFITFVFLSSMMRTAFFMPKSLVRPQWKTAVGIAARSVVSIWCILLDAYAG